MILQNPDRGYCPDCKHEWMDPVDMCPHSPYECDRERCRDKDTCKEEIPAAKCPKCKCIIKEI